jgi:hypothetical protein
MSAIFGNPLKDTFINGTGLGYIGKEIEYKIPINTNQFNGNDNGDMGKAYLGVNKPSNYPIHTISLNDQPLSYGFSLI